MMFKEIQKHPITKKSKIREVWHSIRNDRACGKKKKAEKKEDSAEAASKGGARRGGPARSPGAVAARLLRGLRGTRREVKTSSKNIQAFRLKKQLGMTAARATPEGE